MLLKTLPFDKIAAFVAIFSRHLIALKGASKKEKASHERPILSTSPLILVGKEHCFESSRELPISRLPEAVKAASMMDDVAPFEGKSFHLVQKLDDTRCLVTFSTVKPDIYRDLSTRCWGLLPESLVIKNALALPPYQTMDNPTFYRDESSIHVTNQGTNFRLKVFADSQSEPVSVDAEYEKLVTDGLLKLPPHLLRQAVNKDRLKGLFYRIHWKQCALAVVGMLVLYVGMSSLWLTLRHQQLDEQLTRQQNELDHIFQLKRQLDQSEAVLRNWSEEESITKVTSNIWPVLLDLVEQEVELMSFMMDEEGIMIRGRAKKATDAIAYLAAKEEITLPQSVAPVVNSRGMEIFSVRFQMKGGN